MNKLGSIVIVGGGISGVSTSYYLAKRGINVRFPERPALAKGAENVLQLVLQTVEHGAFGTPVACHIAISRTLQTHLTPVLEYFKDGWNPLRSGSR